MCMMHQHNHGGAQHDHPADQGGRPWYMTPAGLISLGLAAFVVAYYLWTYHNQHVLAVLPFALFLLCPLMHLFGHGGHGGHGRHGDHGHQHEVGSSTRRTGGQTGAD